MAIDEGERGRSSFFAEADAPTFEITYEELADHPEAAARRVLHFLGLEYAAPPGRND